MKRILLALVLAMPFYASASTFCDRVAREPIAHVLQDEEYKHLDVQGALKDCTETTADSVQKVLSSTSPEEATKWGQTAKDFASAIGIAAQQLGMATNSFLQTPAGKLTAVMIAWKVMGQDALELGSYLLQLIICVPLAVMLACFWWRWYKSNLDIKITYEHRPFLWGLWHRRVVTSYTNTGFTNYDGGSSAVIGSFLFAIAFIIVALIGVL